MKLGTKINLVLVLVIAVVLTVAFSIIVSIESATTRKQVLNDAETAAGIFHSEIERMFEQVHDQEVRMQNAIDELSRIDGVVYIDVTSMDGVHVATTKKGLSGTRANESDLVIIEELKREGSITDIRNDAGTFYEIERRIPVRLVGADGKSAIADVIEVGVATRSKNADDIRDAEKLLQVIAVSVEQSVRAIVITYNDSIAALQKIADSVRGFHFFHEFIIFNSQLEVIVNTGGEVDELANDALEYKQLRMDVLEGRSAVAEVARLHNGTPVIMRVTPITALDEKTGVVKNIGLTEVHILKESYEARVNELKIRMFGVGIVFTAILVIVLAVILERKVVGPIRRYSVIARKIADGDFSQIIKHTSNDEIGQFGSIFNSMVANLRELDKLKSDFISVAAHQLRTPLSGVKWVIKLLIDGDLGAVNDEQKGMLKRGYETNEKMIQLVNDLLNVSRIENGKFGYKFEKNDFIKLLNTLMENTVLPSKERDIEVRLENRVVDIPEFLFDPEKLLIALQNIVDNAMKYTLPGGRVTIVVERQGDYIEVKVSDTGVGIPKEDIPKLFSKFFRATNVIHLQTDGSGLGLFIVKSIIMRHGGQVWVDSLEGKGTTFTVVVPVVAGLLPKDENESNLVSTP